MHPQELILALLSLITSTAIVLLSVFIGWFLIWKVFLSKFKLVRELLGQANGDGVNNEQIDRHRTRRVRRE
ncbi:unnamed protein product [Hermetia illucens]|uniref:Uncharacterized protein n=1 Tax=Hermetia illucens TaxID=343691 RepID=A0A7R8YQJ3_HERIL|nr:unnamed protein product [Hermetia illucens]